MHFNKYCSRVSQKIYFHVICPDVALLDSRLKMVNAEKRKYNVPGRTQSQKRSLRWFPGWPPSHWSPVWSSPTQQQKNARFKEWLLKLSANTVEQFVRSLTYIKATQTSSWSSEAVNSPLCTPLSQPCRGLSGSPVSIWCCLYSSWWGCPSL